MPRGRRKNVRFAEAEYADAELADAELDELADFMKSLDGKVKSKDEIMTEQKYDEYKQDKKKKQLNKWENGELDKPVVKEPKKVVKKEPTKREKIYQNRDEIFDLKEQIRCQHRHFAPKYDEVKKISLNRIDIMDLEELDDLKKRINKAVMGYDTPDSNMTKAVYQAALSNVETFLGPFIPSLNGVSFEFENGLRKDLKENDPLICEVDTKPVIKSIHRTLDLLDYQYNPVHDVVRNTDSPLIRLCLLTHNLGQMAREKNMILNQKLKAIEQQNNIIGQQLQILNNQEKIDKLVNQPKEYDDEIIFDEPINDDPKNNIAKPKPDDGYSIEDRLEQIKKDLIISKTNEEISSE